MDVLRERVLKKAIDSQLKEQEKELVEEILSDYNNTDSVDVLCVKIVRNAIGMSVRLSVGAILDMLIGLGITEPHDEDQLRKNILSVVK